MELADTEFETVHNHEDKIQEYIEKAKKKNCCS